jgi:hypothetical protein
MTEVEWSACTDSIPMLEFLRGKASDRKLRLFACACCRDIWDLIPSEPSRTAVEASEEYADGQIQRKKLLQLRERARQKDSNLAEWAVMAATRPQIATAWLARLAVDARRRPGICRAYAPSHQLSPEQCGHLRDLFGPLLFRSVILDPGWLNPAVARVAQAIYAERRFQDMPVLADAFLDAGCDNEEVLAHCRSPDPHVKGCWLLDLLLDKA